LVRSSEDGNTAALSRDHTIRIENSGLITICGGKWTTYRNMAEDCVNQAATLARLPDKACLTANLKIHGYHVQPNRMDALAAYGSDAPAIQEMRRGVRLHRALPYTEAEVIWAAHHEMARTVEDVLARRTRALFLNAQAAIEMAPQVAELLAAELGHDQAWAAAQVRTFRAVAKNYVVGLLFPVK
jgi:glycerol-3-phosphate dehydrogenase